MDPPTPEPHEKGTPDDSGGQPKRPGRASARGLVAALLAAGWTQKATAERAGLSRKTVSRWAAEQGFAERVDRLRERMVSRALGRLESGMGTAAGTLKTLAKGAAEEADRIKAAVQVIQLALKVRDQHDLSARVRKLEEQLKGSEAAGSEHKGSADGDPGGGGPDRAAGTGPAEPRG